MSLSPAYCPHCQKPVEITLPVEPMFPLAFVANLLLTNVDALVNLMRRHRTKLSPPLYRTVRHPATRRPTRYRYLLASDVRVLRDVLYSTTRYNRLLGTSS